MNYAESLSGLDSITKNFYSRWMHAEANRAGMQVRNRRGDTWRACNHTEARTLD